jgi:hypothetical protein
MGEGATNRRNYRAGAEKVVADTHSAGTRAEIDSSCLAGLESHGAEIESERLTTGQSNAHQCDRTKRQNFHRSGSSFRCGEYVLDAENLGRPPSRCKAKHEIVNMAAQRADELADEGDADGAGAWRRILEAIDGLTRGRREGAAELRAALPVTRIAPGSVARRR